MSELQRRFEQRSRLSYQFSKLADSELKESRKEHAMKGKGTRVSSGSRQPSRMASTNQFTRNVHFGSHRRSKQEAEELLGEMLRKYAM